MITDYDTNLILSHVDTRKLDEKRILMTGGTGFVGRWMSMIPANITALGRRDYEAGGWEHQRWDVIVHLANVPAGRVIASARRNGAPILYASSGAATDAYPGEYAQMKLDTEQELLESGLPVYIARMYTFTGAYMPNRFAVINYIHDAIIDKVITIRGRVDVQRTYLYAADMAVWMWNILLRGKAGTTYAVGAERAVTMWELAREVQRHFDHPMITEELVYQNEPRPVYLPDVIKTKMDCGVEVYTPFEDAISRTVAHYVEEARLSTR